MFLVLIASTSCNNVVDHAYHGDWDKVYKIVKSKDIESSIARDLFIEANLDGGSEARKVALIILDKDYIDNYEDLIDKLYTEDEEIITILIEKGANINYQKSYNGYTSLMHHITNQNHAFKTNDETLNEAIRHYDYRIKGIKVLLKFNPSLLLKSKEGKTIMDYMNDQKNLLNSKNNPTAKREAFKRYYEVMNLLNPIYSKQKRNKKKEEIYLAKEELSNYLSSWRNNLKEGDNVRLFFDLLLNDYIEDWFISNIYSNGDYLLKSNSEYGTKKVTKYRLFPRSWSESKIKKYLNN